MNLTVGPHSPAVYWRRRAMVLGALAAVIVVGVALCGGLGGSDKPAQRQGAVAGDGSPTGEPLATATASQLAPILGGSADAGVSTGPSSSATEPAPVPAEPVTPLTPCADAQMSVSVAVQPLRAGYYLTLTVKNTSTTGCSRDVGAAAQEVFVTAGTATIWSSDCLHGSPAADVRNFNPGIWASFKVYWDGYQYAGCTRQGPHPAGSVAHAKVGNLLSPAIPIAS